MSNACLLLLALATIEVLVFAVIVGRARGKYGVPAPATSGHPTWERLNRVHQNSIEHLVVFMPLFLLYATAVDQRQAVVIGIIFVVARLLYAVGYAREASKRAVGSLLTFLVEIWMAVLVVIALLLRLAR
ncbi:MAG: MAPEG family protein [bacterium]|nr:MAPEG family protein [bacterium]